MRLTNVKAWNNFVSFLVIVGTLSLTSKTTDAVSDLTAKEALDVIADFADRICEKIPLDGSSETLRLSGQGMAELSGLIKKLVTLGIEGATDYQTETYQGLLREDLAATLNESIKCKADIFKQLKEVFLEQGSALRIWQNELRSIEATRDQYVSERNLLDGEVFKDKVLLEEREHELSSLNNQFDKIRRTIKLLRQASDEHSRKFESYRSRELYAAADRQRESMHVTVEQMNKVAEDGFPIEKRINELKTFLERLEKTIDNKVERIESLDRQIERENRKAENLRQRVLEYTTL